MPSPPSISTATGTGWHDAREANRNATALSLRLAIAGDKLTAMIAGKRTKVRLSMHFGMSAKPREQVGRELTRALTFDMRGVHKQAKLACGRPLDGRVRPRWGLARASLHALDEPADGGQRQILDGLFGSLLHALPSPQMLNGR